jgi:hypothetical protein
MQSPGDLYITLSCTAAGVLTVDFVRCTAIIRPRENTVEHAKCINFEQETGIEDFIGRERIVWGSGVWGPTDKVNI